jgi:hypothetical protein
VFFDVRADANALYHTYGVEMPPESVVDLQLLDVAATCASGKTIDRVRGLQSLFKSPHGSACLSRAEKQRMDDVKTEVGRWAAVISQPTIGSLCRCAGSCFVCPGPRGLV